MKRLIAAGLLLALFCSLCACAKTPNQQNGKTTLLLEKADPALAPGELSVTVERAHPKNRDYSISETHRFALSEASPEGVWQSGEMTYRLDTGVRPMAFCDRVYAQTSFRSLRVVGDHAVTVLDKEWGAVCAQSARAAIDRWEKDPEVESIAVSFSSAAKELWMKES